MGGRKNFEFKQNKIANIKMCRDRNKTQDNKKFWYFFYKKSKQILKIMENVFLN